MLTLPLPAFAQLHHNIWLRTTFQISLDSNWSAGLELQHRRQDMAGGSNPMAYDLMYSVRPWLYYQPKKATRIELAPFSFFRLSSPVNTSSDIGKAPQQEIRSTLALRYLRPLRGRFSLNLRPALEYRMIDHHPDLLRIRTRFQVQREIGRHFVLFALDEVMLQPLGVPPAHLLDQNRLGGGIQWNFGTQMSLEAGYIYLSRLPATSDELIAEHNFFIQFYWRRK